MLSDIDNVDRAAFESDVTLADGLFGKVLDLSENGLFLMDADHKIVLWNEWMVQASSIVRQQAIGSIFGELFPELMSKRIESAINTALKQRSASLLSRSLNRTMFPLYYVAAGGEKRDIEQSVVVKPIRNDGENYCLVQITDVTRMVQREGVLRILASEAGEAQKAAEDISRFKSEFTSTVSHELRTPLTSIRGSLGLIASGVMGELLPEVRKLIEIACNNTERLLFLINDILDMEKIESGKMGFVMGPVDLMAVLRQSIDANQPYGEQYKIRYVLKEVIDDVKVNADTDRLMQVLNNLLSNAAKFSPEGAIVEISVVWFKQMVRINVRDYGEGIPLKFQSRIFEKFSQADGSDTRKVGGTGLGLSISKAIMEQMEGVISFETEAGKGTIFHVDISRFDG